MIYIRLTYDYDDDGDDDDGDGDDLYIRLTDRLSNSSASWTVDCDRVRGELPDNISYKMKTIASSSSSP